MKLKDLTKEQREQIEADEVGKELLNRWEQIYDYCGLNMYGEGVHDSIIKEIKRTIKRIDDEIEFLETAEISAGGEFHDEETFTIENSEQVFNRLIYLKKQKQLYELMEQLE